MIKIQNFIQTLLIVYEIPVLNSFKSDRLK
jgi:hypothetical protein